MDDAGDSSDGKEQSRRPLILVFIGLGIIGALFAAPGSDDSDSYAAPYVPYTPPPQPPSPTPPTSGDGNFTFTAWASDADQTLDLTIRTWEGSWTIELEPNSEVADRLDLRCANGEIDIEFTVRNVLGENVGRSFPTVSCAGFDCYFAWVMEDGTTNEWGEPLYKIEVWDDQTARRGSCA